MPRLRLVPYAALTAALLCGTAAGAQPMTDVETREARQQARISEGIREGDLNRHEANRLERNEQRIERFEQRARADGVVTPTEHRHLDRMLDRQDRAIYRERHDRQRASADRDHDGHSGGLERRDDHQQGRILDGVRSGQITRAEAARLARGEARIERTEGHARADGVVTPAGRHRIQLMQDKESHDLYRARHNTNVAGTGRRQH